MTEHAHMQAALLNMTATSHTGLLSSWNETRCSQVGFQRLSMKKMEAIPSIGLILIYTEMIIFGLSKICLNHLFCFTFYVWLLDSLKLHTQHGVYLMYFFWTVLLQSFPVRSAWVKSPARTTLPWILLLCPSSQCSSPGNTPSLCQGNRTSISGSPRSQT